MASKKHNPGCPCCDGVAFPCTPTDCGDETTSPIRRVTLTLDMPDEIVAIGMGEGGSSTRVTHITSGWSTVNGTYTFELNLSTCVWSSFHLLDTSGVFIEAWRLPSTTNCSNYLSLIDPDTDIPIISPQYLAGANLQMATTGFGLTFFHFFSVSISGLGPFFSWQIKPGSGGNVCGESSLVFDKVFLNTADAEYVCDGDDALTSKANSYEI